jgi:TPP-dependent pyruvate/acetoin dehydrogenase alpha subunit
MMRSSADLLRVQFRDILRIRMVEERIVQLYPEQEMRCPVHLSIGQEAVAVGVCSALSQSDWVFSGHRNHAHYLAKGGNLKRMLAEIYGKATGCSAGKGGSMHLTDQDAGFLGATPIVGSTIPIAVGAALSSSMRHEERVTVVFFGDGATETGVFHESLNVAEIKKLPVLFVCENNLYSVYSPLAVRQPQERSLTGLAAGHGVRSEHGDGNEVERVYALATECALHARAGKGPVFIEFSTYRFREHCGPNLDDDLGYRSTDEVHEWMKRDPLSNLKSRLLSEGVMTGSEATELERQIRLEIDEAVTFAKGSPFPSPEQLSNGTYA